MGVLELCGKKETSANMFNHGNATERLVKKTGGGVSISHKRGYLLSEHQHNLATA